MINVFSKSFQKDNGEILLGEEFVTRTFQDSQIWKHEAKKQSDPVMRKMILFVISQFVKVVFILLGIITIGKAQNTSSTFYYVAGIGGIVFGLFLHFYSKSKMQETVYQEQYRESGVNVNSELAEQMKEMGIPEEEKEIEVMYTLCETEDVEFITYLNELVCVFREENDLCFVTRRKKLVIPIADINAIKLIQQEAALDAWYKETDFDEGIYKQYGIKTDASTYDKYYITTDYGRGVVIPYYYSIVIRDMYEILIPPYELNIILELTGLSVSEPDKSSH